MMNLKSMKAILIVVRYGSIPMLSYMIFITIKAILLASNEGPITNFPINYISSDVN